MHGLCLIVKDRVDFKTKHTSCHFVVKVKTYARVAEPDLTEGLLLVTGGGSRGGGGGRHALLHGRESVQEMV